MPTADNLADLIGQWRAAAAGLASQLEGDDRSDALVNAAIVTQLRECADQADRLPAMCPAAVLHSVQLWESSDSVKRDLESVCLICGEHLCDAQRKDDLAALTSVAGSHQHHFRVLAFYSYAPGDLIETIGVGTWDPATGTVATEDGEQLGAAKTADEARMLFGDVCDGAVYWEPFDHEEDPGGER
jgi:hypothetical protein